MASAVTTNAGASATTNSGLKRTLASGTQDSARGGSDNLQPATKRPKRETKLERLKGEHKAAAVNLKKKIELVLELVKDKCVANEIFLKSYIECCDDLILAGTEPHGGALVAFKTDIGVYFASEADLHKNLDDSMLPCRRRSASLTSTTQCRGYTSRSTVLL